MIYKIQQENSVFQNLELLPSLNIFELAKYENELEILLTKHLLKVLFKEGDLMQIYQEQPEPSQTDIYALNKNGDLVIFNLTKILDAARQENGDLSEIETQVIVRWSDVDNLSFADLEKSFQKCDSTRWSKSLAKEHSSFFKLKRPLLPTEFNRQQHFIFVGSVRNEVCVNALIEAANYFKGIAHSVEFAPYRVYQINNELYLEFFSIPSARHLILSDVKGVLLDMDCREDELFEMMKNNKVAAHGDKKYLVEALNAKDIAFLMDDKKIGIVAAAEVVGPLQTRGDSGFYRDVKFLTLRPTRESGFADLIPLAEIQDAGGKSCLNVRSTRVPYFTRKKALSLVEELKYALRREDTYVILYGSVIDIKFKTTHQGKRLAILKVISDEKEYKVTALPGYWSSYKDRLESGLSLILHCVLVVDGESEWLLLKKARVSTKSL